MRWALAVMLFAPWVVFAETCGVLPKATRIESARFALAFRTVPEVIPVGKHFTVEMAVCPLNGTLSPESVRIDAHMPEHRHGMNYAATVVLQPGGAYRADGLMFHMPGRWELVFEVRAGGKTDRLVKSVVVE